MVPFNYTGFIDTAKLLLAEQRVPMSRIDDAVTRILRVKFEMGLFEKPYADKSLGPYIGESVSVTLCFNLCSKYILYEESNGIL